VRTACGAAHVLSPQDLGWAGVPADRREPPRRRPGSPAGDRHAREARGSQASGQLERLLRSGARFAAKAMVLSALDDDTAVRIATRRIGPALVFERLWEGNGCLEETMVEAFSIRGLGLQRQAGRGIPHFPAINVLQLPSGNTGAI
jgi:hypothetical protein